jgi:hypothetical protein
MISTLLTYAVDGLQTLIVGAVGGLICVAYDWIRCKRKGLPF